MGVSGGPKLKGIGRSSANLALGYDCIDSKSYAGEPTQNYFINTSVSGYGWAGDGSNQTVGTKGAVGITDDSLKYNDYPTVLWTPGSSRNAYLHSSSDIDISATSTEWTFSVYAKYEDGTNLTSMNVYMYYPSSDGVAAGTITDVGGGWKRISRTRTGSSNYINLAGISGIAANKRIYLSGWQLEKKQYVTPVVGINSSRSSTDAWVDLSKNADNGTFVNGTNTNTSHRRKKSIILVNVDDAAYLNFDGTNDYIDCGNTYSFGTNSSVGVWFYGNSNQGSFVSPISKDQSGNFGNFSMSGSSTSDKVRFGFFDTNGSNHECSNSSYLDLIGEEWVYYVGTFDGSTLRLYRNGVQIASKSTSTTPSTNSNSVLIGKRHASSDYFSGKIGLVHCCDKALTPAEVKSNFNQLRSRFGV